MVNLEKEIEKSENKFGMNKWQTAWEMTKLVGAIGVYAGAMAAGYYIGNEIGGETIGQLGAIAAGVAICHGQDSNDFADGLE